MGLIATTKAEIPDFKQAVISFWFRVPQASVDAALAAFHDNAQPIDAPGVYPPPTTPLNGIIPLVTFGERSVRADGPRAHNFDLAFTRQVRGYVIHGGDGGPVTTQLPGVSGRSPSGNSPFGYYPFREDWNLGTSYSGPTELPEPAVEPVLQFSAPTEPTLPGAMSFIGVNVNGDTPRLCVRLQTNQIPVVANWASQVDSIEGAVSNGAGGRLYTQGTRVYGGDFDFFGALTGVYFEISSDVHDVVAPPPTGAEHPDIHHYADVTDLFFRSTEEIGSNVIPVTPDKWHHVMISVDLPSIRTHGMASNDETADTAKYVDSYPRLFIALDDVNKTGFDLSDDHVDGLDDNAVLPFYAARVAGAGPDDQLGMATYSLADPTLSVRGIIGFPADPRAADSIYKVELAEFQMYTGVMLDTGVEDNRRLFIDAKGRPVNARSDIGPISGVVAAAEIGAVLLDKGASAPAAAQAAQTVLDALVTSANDPFAPALKAIKALRKAPDVLLHGSRRWVMGQNLGVAKTPFERQGTAMPYRPDPKLGA